MMVSNRSDKCWLFLLQAFSSRTLGRWSSCFQQLSECGGYRPTGYFVYCNAGTDKTAFDGKLEFDVRLIAYEGNDDWVEGVIYRPTHLIITGAIDDLWINSREEYIVVDYKATSKDEVIDKLNDTWHHQYRRQMEIYQWLLRANGYRVSPTGYFVYCNAGTDKTAFDGKLEFDVRLIAYEGNDDWVEGVIYRAKECLMGSALPQASPNCDYCTFAEARARVER